MASASSHSIPYQNLLGLNPTFLENMILSLKKMKTNIRSLPVKELSNSVTPYLQLLALRFFTVGQFAVKKKTEPNLI